MQKEEIPKTFDRREERVLCAMREMKNELSSHTKSIIMGGERVHIMIIIVFKILSKMLGGTFNVVVVQPP